MIAHTNGRMLAFMDQMGKNMVLPNTEFPLESVDSVKEMDAKIIISQ